jgi:hypothetical protein
MTPYDELQRRLAAEAGLPAGLAERLRGDTPEELAADANRLAALLPSPPPPPPATHNELIRQLLAENRGKHRDLINKLHPPGTNRKDT